MVQVLCLSLVHSAAGSNSFYDLNYLLLLLLSLSDYVALTSPRTLLLSVLFSCVQRMEQLASVQVSRGRASRPKHSSTKVSLNGYVDILCACLCVLTHSTDA